MPSDRASIVLFMVDQLSARWLEAGSAGIIPTPNLDRLRAAGTSFSRVFPSNPICMACRATIATGLSTRGHGLLTNGYELNPGLTTFMQLLQRDGYRTAASGKLHFRPHFAGVHPDYRPYGFDVAHITEDARGGEWLDWVEREHPEHYESVLATIWPTEIPDFKSYGPGRVNLTERIARIKKSFVWATEEFPHNTPHQYTLPFPDEVSQTEWITRHALEAIRESDRARPLFVQASYVQPHGPFCPPGRYMQEVDPSRIPPPAPIEWLEDPAAPACFGTSEGAHRSIPDDWRETRRYYFADLVHLDRQLGLVMDSLEAAGREAFVIFLSDHGELLLDHGFTGKGERHYDASVRVPLIISGPGLRRGAVVDSFVQLEDIFPTILEMAGIGVPAPRIMGPYLKERPRALAGRSLLPLCRGERPTDWRQDVYIESYNNITTATPRNWARSVRTAEWRYTMYPEGQGEQLFRIATDPDEQVNLARDSAYSSARMALRDRLLDLVILQDYPQPPRDLFALGVH